VIGVGWRVRDRHVTAVRPRPEFQPYVTLMDAETPTLDLQGRRCQSNERGGGLEGILTRIIEPDLFTPRDVPVGLSVRDAATIYTRSPKVSPPTSNYGRYRLRH
jgi:hypothetical protein